jgi:hypothetical protein
MTDDAQLLELIEKPVDRRHVDIEPLSADLLADLLGKLRCRAMA